MEHVTGRVVELRKSLADSLLASRDLSHKKLNSATSHTILEEDPDLGKEHSPADT